VVEVQLKSKMHNYFRLISELRCIITLGASLHLLLSLSTFPESDFEYCQANFEIGSGGANHSSSYCDNTTEAGIHRCSQRCANVLQAQGIITD
jgi:hypothetical protein